MAFAPILKCKNSKSKLYTMRKITLLTLISLGLLFTACNKVKQLTSINVDIPYTQQFSVPQIPGDTQSVALPAGGVTLPFPAIPFATNSQQYLSQYNTAANLITGVTLKSLQPTNLIPGKPELRLYRYPSVVHLRAFAAPSAGSIPVRRTKGVGYVIAKHNYFRKPEKLFYTRHLFIFTSRRISMPYPPQVRS